MAEYGLRTAAARAVLTNAPVGLGLAGDQLQSVMIDAKLNLEAVLLVTTRRIIGANNYSTVTDFAKFLG